MITIVENLCTFNQVKFSAYRTAMKLRALQKHLLLDLVSLADINAVLKRTRGAQLDERININDAIL